MPLMVVAEMWNFARRDFILQSLKKSSTCPRSGLLFLRWYQVVGLVQLPTPKMFWYIEAVKGAGRFLYQPKKYTDGLYFSTTSVLKFLWKHFLNMSKRCTGVNFSIFVKNPFPAHFKHVRSNYCKLKIFEVFAHFKKGTSVCSFEVVQCTRLLKKWKTSYFSFQDFAGAHFKIGLQIFETCA